jgi:hypothetical protein
MERIDEGDLIKVMRESWMRNDLRNSNVAIKNSKIMITKQAEDFLELGNRVANDIDVARFG